MAELLEVFVDNEKYCVASVWAQALFYSVGLYLLVVALTGEFSVMTMVQSVLVMTTQRYCFVTAYLLMYLVSPFLNCAIRAMDRRKHLICCGVLLLVFSVLHNLVYIFDFGYIRGGNSMLWFCVLYMISAYIRLYVPAQRKHRSGYWIYAGCVAVIAGERFAAYYITTRLLGYCVGDRSKNNSPVLDGAAKKVLQLIQTFQRK